MQEAVATSRAYVTAHAVTRYINHFEGVDLGLDERFFGGLFVMLLHLFAAGLTKAEVIDRILKRPVLEAMERGEGEVRVGRFVAAIKGRYVVTVKPFRPVHTPRKFKEPTRRESRRLFRQIGVRQKRAPV